MQKTWTFATDAYGPGVHAVKVISTDQGGTSRTDSFNVITGPNLSLTAQGVGIEDYFAYRSLDTGAGSQALVNVANGNFVWHHRPVSNAGRGLDTAVDVTYNSLGGDADLGHGYGEIGDGFSLAISSLTRVNEPLDVRAAATGTITLTDADATMHRFKKNSGGAWFDPPAGVNLRLRKFYDSPVDDAQRNQTWAATRPDGTTYFLDPCGYQRSVEDRHGNALRFAYDDARMPVAPGCVVNPALPPRLVSVTDAGARALTLSYVAGVDVRLGNRIERITDHAGRKLVFSYAGDATRRLIGMEEASTTASARSFAFAYETAGIEQDLEEIPASAVDRHADVT